MENQSFCVGCGSKLLKQNKTMEFMGLVCSRCFRLSNAKYVEMVDRIAKQRFAYVLEACARLRSEAHQPPSPEPVPPARPASLPLECYQEPRE